MKANVLLGTVLVLTGLTALILCTPLSPFLTTVNSSGMLLNMLLASMPIIGTAALVDWLLSSYHNQPSRFGAALSAALVVLFPLFWLNHLFGSGWLLLQWPGYTGMVGVVLVTMLSQLSLRWPFRYTALVSAALLSAILFAARTPALGGHSTGSNVLLVVVDAVHAEYVQDESMMPELNHFADRPGTTRYKQAYATSSWSLPSLVSMNTGLMPPEHRVQGPRQKLSPDARTTAEIMRSSGYYTGAVSANGFFDPRHGTTQGFEHFVSVMQAEQRKLVERIAGPMGDWLTLNDDIRTRHMGRAVNNTLRRMIDRMGRPFFIEAFYIDPHSPYYDYDDRCAGSIDPEDRIDPDDRTVRSIQCHYRSELQYWDRMFGRLVDMLEKRDLLDSTTLIVTADHGEAFNQHGRIGHQSTISPIQTHVPLFVYRPTVQSDPAVQRPVSTASIHATITEIGQTGTGTTQALPRAGSDSYSTPAFMSLVHEQNERYGLIDGDVQLVKNRDGEMLYGLNGLRSPVDSPERRRALLGKLNRLLERYRSHPDLSQPVDFDRSDRAALKGLGYL